MKLLSYLDVVFHLFGLLVHLYLDVEVGIMHLKSLNSLLTQFFHVSLLLSLEFCQQRLILLLKVLDLLSQVLSLILVLTLCLALLLLVCLDCIL